MLPRGILSIKMCFVYGYFILETPFDIRLYWAGNRAIWGHPGIYTKALYMGKLGPLPPLPRDTVKLSNEVVEIVPGIGHIQC